MAVISTASCFAPRNPDEIIPVSSLCKDYDIPHVINNAYGFQSIETCRKIDKAFRIGRVDIVVMSTDKNLMVPVGGAVIMSGSKKLLNGLVSNYPGRAGISPSIDVFITLLSMGKKGYHNLRLIREKTFTEFKNKLKKVAKKNGERLLETANPISTAISLKALNNPDAVQSFGRKLFNAYCFGARFIIPVRAVSPENCKTIGGLTFNGYGSHHNDYPFAYLSCAVAIGASPRQLDSFLNRLDKIFAQNN